MEILKGKRFSLPIISFAVYNLIYAFYMAGYLPRSVNLIALMLFTIVIANKPLKKKKFRFLKETKLVLFTVVVFFLISIVKQIYYQDLNFIMMSGLLYVVLSILDAFFVINSSKNDELYTYLFIIFIRLVLLFFISNAGNINLKTIMLISWRDTKSSVFESGMAHEWLFMVLIFKYMRKNKLAIVSAIFCMLCFKRLSFILCILALFLYRFIPEHKAVNKKIIILSKVLFILSPLFVSLLVSPEGQRWFYNLFHITLNQFTTGREYYINLVTSRMDYYNGYGSTGYFLKVIYGDQYVQSIHCDLLRITLECTIISTIVYVNNMIEVSKRSYLTFFMMLYCLFESVISHCIEGFTLYFTLYIFIYIVNTDIIIQRSQAKNIKEHSYG